MNFQKLRDIKIISERLVKEDELLAALFDEIPELEHFSYTKSQEYDDNNYFDSIQVTEINGHPYGFEGYEDDYEEDEPSKLPKIENHRLVESAVSIVADGHDPGYEETTVSREDFKKGKGGDHHAERTYLSSYLSGTTLPDSFFLKTDPKWAIYYAMDHGRFSEKTEFKLFAKRGLMYRALDYARHVIKGRLPQNVENFYILDAHEDDNPDLKSYLEFVGHGKKTEGTVEVLPEVHQGSVIG